MRLLTGAKKEAKIRIAVRDLAVKLKESDILGRKNNFDGMDLY